PLQCQPCNACNDRAIRRRAPWRDNAADDPGSPKPRQTRAMKTSLEWLSQYLPGPLDPQTAADALTNGGLPVEVIEKVGDDTVIDVEVTSNRSDCLSHVGVARELAALLN